MTSTPSTVLGILLRDVISANPDTFRIMGREHGDDLPEVRDRTWPGSPPGPTGAASGVN